MMAVAAFAVLLANAVIGNGSDDRATNPALRWAAPVLAVAVLPLAGIAYYSMNLRVIKYGWTPERLWSVIAALIAITYVLAGDCKSVVLGQSVKVRFDHGGRSCITTNTYTNSINLNRQITRCSKE